MPQHKKWSIAHIFSYGFAIAGIAGALLIWSIYRVTTTIMATATSVSQTYEVISSFRNLRERLIDAETAERGYVITGDPAGLPAYQTALQQIQFNSDLIAAFVSNYPGQKVRFVELQKQIAYRLKTLQMIVDTRVAGGIDASHELVSLGEDKLEMKRIQSVLMQMEDEENVQLNKRLRARDVAYREFWWSFFALIVTLSASTMWQYLHVRRIMQLEAEARRRIRHMAEHDPLTELPNRRQLQEKLDLALAYAKRSGKKVAVMFIDLDGFKAVNDSMGHQAGDELLKVVAQRLRQATRSNDFVARLGGDEFVVVLSELDQLADATRLAAKLNNLISMPVPLTEGIARISTSIGISLFPANGRSSAELLGKADDAVYQAKAAGKNQFQWAACA